MVSHPSELSGEIPGRTPTVMYLFQIKPNGTPAGDDLHLQMLSQNAHYNLIPIEESNQTERQKKIQHHKDKEITNVKGTQNDLIKEQMTTKVEEQIPLTETPVQKYVHIPDSVPQPRALLTLPSVLRVRRGIVEPEKMLPPGVRFGPVQGVAREISNNYAQTMISQSAACEKPIFLISKDDSISYIDVSDKEHSNWFSLLPLGDSRSANLWLKQHGDELFAYTTRPVRARSPLRLGYSRRYAEVLSLPEGLPVLEDDVQEEHHKWWCHECRVACKSAALLQRHTDEMHTVKEESKTKTRRRRYRCKNCALPFARLFTLKRHMAIHCKNKMPKPVPQPVTETAQPVQETFLNTEDDRLPSDESFQNYTNGLDFSTSLFDTDRLSALDISASSRTDLNFYSEKDDSLLPVQPDTMGQLVEIPPVDAISPNKAKAEVTSTNATMTCPHCQENIPMSSKNQHLRECVSRSLTCACGASFRSRARLDRHVYDDHKTSSSQENTNEDNKLDVSDSNSIDSFKCNECQLTFKRRGMYVNHMWRQHGSQAHAPLRREQRRYPCVACPKLYQSAAKRAVHVRIHHPGADLKRAPTISLGSVSLSPAACPHCPRQYATRAKLLQHVRAAH